MDTHPDLWRDRRKYTCTSQSRPTLWEDEIPPCLLFRLPFQHGSADGSAHLLVGHIHHARVLLAIQADHHIMVGGVAQRDTPGFQRRPRKPDLQDVIDLGGNALELG